MKECEGAGQSKEYRANCGSSRHPADFLVVEPETRYGTCDDVARPRDVVVGRMMQILLATDRLELLSLEDAKPVALDELLHDEIRSATSQRLRVRFAVVPDGRSVAALSLHTLASRVALYASGFAGSVLVCAALTASLNFARVAGEYGY